MVEALRRFLIGLAFAGYTGCGGIKPPPVVVPPPPEPPAAEQCANTGQACGCWDHPPEAQGWLYACCQPGVPGGVVLVQDPAQCISQPPPAPTCPEACPAGQECTDPAVGCVAKPPVPPDPPIPPPTGTNCDGEPGAATGQTTGVHGPVVNEVIRGLTGCSIGSDCNLGNTTQQQFLRAVIGGVRARGLCAGQHEPGVTDEIAVSDTPVGIREGGHVFAGDDSNGPVPPGGVTRKVVWFPGAARPSYYAGTDTTPPPIDPPPTGGACSAPLPPKVWTVETIPPGYDPALVGHTRYVIGCREHGRNDVDCAATSQRTCDYCEAIGMGQYDGGLQRCGCPVRNECKPPEQIPPQNFKCEERVACEKYLTGGTVLEAKPGSGAACEFVDGNPFMFKKSGGNCRLCGANGTTYNGERLGCGGWF